MRWPRPWLKIVLVLPTLLVLALAVLSAQALEPAPEAVDDPALEAAPASPMPETRDDQALFFEEVSEPRLYRAFMDKLEPYFFADPVLAYNLYMVMARVDLNADGQPEYAVRGLVEDELCVQAVCRTFLLQPMAGGYRLIADVWATHMWRLDEATDGYRNLAISRAGHGEARFRLMWDEGQQRYGVDARTPLPAMPWQKERG